MSQHPDAFADFDGAYVLGALSQEDRQAYEQHLAVCESCAESVRSLQSLPGLLATVENPKELEAAPEPPATLLPGLLREVRRVQRRRRWYTGGIAAAVAACIAAIVVLVARADNGPGGHPLQMQPVAASSMHATADVQAVSWGTRIELKCSYDASTLYPPDSAYSLVAVDRAGHQHDLGSWRLVRGGVTTFNTGTSLHRDEISRIVVQTTSGRDVLQLAL
jgi:anti-sigma-K factor RskA